MSMMNKEMNSCFVFPPPINTPKQDCLNEKLVTFGENNNLPTKVTTSHTIDEKSAPQKKQGKTSKRKNLSVREDVMNKNIFRAFKRELKNLFQNFMSSNGTNNSEKDNDKFMKQVREFTSASLLGAHINLQGISEFNLDVCNTYMGIMLDY